MGHVELRPRNANEVDVSYTINPDHRRRGFATRAVRLASTWAFEHGFSRIVAEWDARNAASGGVARAAGFVVVDRRPGGRTYENGGTPGDAVIAELRPSEM